jgi:pantothenate kinase
MKNYLARLPFIERRYFLGITGPPGAGKSTVAHNIVDMVGSDLAVTVPMDGFHHSNDRLEALGLLHLKGIPATFDGEGFVALLEHIKQAGPDETIQAPAFDRSLEATVANAIEVRLEHRLIVVEGNYLLYLEPP